MPDRRRYSFDMSDYSRYKKVMLIILIIISIIGSVILLQYDSNESSITDTADSVDEVERIEPTTTLLANTSRGTVTVEGPFGAAHSDTTVAYILGVHPRESGSHRIMDLALREKSDSLNYTYYIYQINVTEDATDFNKSRTNGQHLANKYVVPDILNKTYNLAIDVHYSDGSWGVPRFIYTPVDNNTQSYNISHELADHFEWLTYYDPGENASSPIDVTEPLNDGGVPAIIYEAYSYDNETTTREHDNQLIDYIDNMQLI
ncbi:hypothetical protein [Methanosphaera sp. WGK6]|uniref:hypothetical protein n=1 Tax=Methanosphaera sp. WGK6 TaxID=1561964 RepID=UPI00084C1E8F|nr:hypothetical protein [Methanosphaera sp. WGK6]